MEDDQKKEKKGRQQKKDNLKKMEDEPINQNQPNWL